MGLRIKYATHHKSMLDMRAGVVALILLFAIAACGDPATGEPTPRPTCTPYPTYTPAPTATPRPTYTPYPEANTVQEDTETIELGSEEWFFGRTLAAVERGQELYELGQYEAAISAFEESKELRGKPSATLENWIGLSSDSLGEYDLAIQHHSYAIAIEDDVINRVNRATSYLENGQCALAMADSKTALAMEPQSTEGYHTDVEANVVLAMCYYEQGDDILALQHADASISIAEENQYSAEDIEYIEEIRDIIRQAATR